MNKEIIEKLRKEKNAGYVSQINYNKKTYVQAIKDVKDGIEYIFYEINDNDIKEIYDREILEYLQKNYVHKSSDIIY